ncbi:MAG: hypothetical protein JWO36_497 [Myxococcales bacterium]|nr:hypothetical protein [Myxococcales bacterium]
MSNLTEIAHRHGRDRLKDAVFICAALLLTAISLGSVTSKAAGKASQHEWTVTVIESNVEIVR